MLTARSRIQATERTGFRCWLWTAWYTAGSGLLLVTIGCVTFWAVDRVAGETLAYIGANIFIWGPPLIALLGWIIKKVATPRIIATTILLIIFLGALPPLVVLVTGQSPHYLLGPQATGAAGPAEVAVLLILSIVVILSPMYVSTWLSWNTAPKSMRKLLPEAIATIATGATIIYALILHLSKGPLGNSSLTKVIIAGLITAVFLRPLYRYLATTCWRWGPTEVFLIRHSRAANMRMLRKLYGSWRTAELQQGNPKANRGSTRQQASNGAVLCGHRSGDRRRSLPGCAHRQRDR